MNNVIIRIRFTIENSCIYESMSYTGLGSEVLVVLVDVRQPGSSPSA